MHNGKAVPRSISTIFDNGRREKFKCELISSSISRQSNRARGFEAKSCEPERGGREAATLIRIEAKKGPDFRIRFVLCRRILAAVRSDLKKRTSAKGRTVDALASQGDEGRGKLR